LASRHVCDPAIGLAELLHAAIGGAVISSHLTRLTKAMGRPRNKLQQEQDKARESRQRMLDATLELLTSDAISSERVRESTMALVYLEPKLLAEIDRIGRSYDEPKTREVRVALLLGIALRALNELLK
jgi:hypothetical protein